MQKQSFFFFLLILLNLACISGDGQDRSQTTDLIIDVDNPQILYMSDFFTRIEYLELITPPDKPVGNIFKIVEKGGYFFLYDRSRKSVWVFDRKGFYVNEIDIPEGRGPNELEHLKDVYISDSLKIHALGQYKIVVFDLNGESIGQTSMVFNPSYIFYNEERQLYAGYVTAMLNVNVPDSIKMFNLFYFNTNGEIIDVDIKIRPGAEGISYNIPSYFTEYSGEIYFSPHINDTLFRFEDGFFEPEYTFNFGAYQINDAILERRGNYSTAIWDWVAFWRTEVQGNGLVSNLTFYEETTGLLLLRAGNSLAQNLIVFDKMNNEVLVGTDRLANDIDFGPSPFMYSSSDSNYFTFFEANSFFDKIRELEVSIHNLSPNTMKLVDSANSMNNTGNPILAIYYPKSRKE